MTATKGKKRIRYPSDEHLDPKIEKWVRLLQANGVHTFESCQGGEGHSFYEPTIRFYGDQKDGLLALAIANKHRLPVNCLRRVWEMTDGDISGPFYELTFWPHLLPC